MEELIAKRYVKALKETAKDIKKVAKVLNILAEAMTIKEVREYITSPLVPTEKKSELLLSLIGDDADPILINFIKILAENKRLELIPVIAKVLDEDLRKASNKFEGIVESQEILDKNTISELEMALEKYTGAEIKLKHKKSNLDGLHVDVDDLGIEVKFSKTRVKEQLIDFIVRSI